MTNGSIEVILFRCSEIQSSQRTIHMCLWRGIAWTCTARRAQRGPWHVQMKQACIFWHEAVHVGSKNHFLYYAWPISWSKSGSMWLICWMTHTFTKPGQAKKWAPSCTPIIYLNVIWFPITPDRYWFEILVTLDIWLSEYEYSAERRPWSEFLRSNKEKDFCQSNTK